VGLGLLYLTISCATSQYRCSVYADDAREVIPILNSQAIDNGAALFLANNLQRVVYVQGDLHGGDHSSAQIPSCLSGIGTFGNQLAHRFRMMIGRLPGAMAIDLSLACKVAQKSGDEPVNERVFFHLRPVWRRLADSLVFNAWSINSSVNRDDHRAKQES
jgi:hypothetical protein